MMNYGVLDYQCVNGRFNIGDYVQSLAAMSHLPACSRHINREELNLYSGPKIKVILNGWFMHNPANWPPSNDIVPLFVSFHINRPFANAMLTPEGIEYLKRHEPIGCRDYYTAEILRERGIDAFYTGCLTTTLSSHKTVRDCDHKVLFVDVLHAVPNIQAYTKMPVRSFASHLRSGNLLRSLSKKRIKRSLIDSIKNRHGVKIDFLENSISCYNLSTSCKFEMARRYLTILSEASLVITSRIHCALPCLAMGVPVVFVKYGQTSQSNIQRFRGVIDHMNVLDLDGDCNARGIFPKLVSFEQVARNEITDNPTTHMPLAENLRKICKQFV